MSMQSILVHVFDLAVTFVVPALVWLTLAAGLLQLVGRWVHRLNVAHPSSRSLARRSAH